jgi:mannose-6-phosphate isomerase-like protein (cupin superfamily)
MIRKGDVIDNPVTGERLVFLETSADTGGEYVLVECTVQPNGFVAAAHVHPNQTERFEIESGTVAFKLDGETIVAGAGESVVVPPGSSHKFWNAGETEAVFVTEVRPALGFERLIETMFTLATDGKVNRKGMPSPLRLAVIANHHFGDVRLPFPPAWLQRLGLVLAAPLGRLLGFRATYEAAEPSSPTALGV